MTYLSKAHVGDFLFVDAMTQRVLFVHHRDEQPAYELEDGGHIGNRDFSYDDVLLESEVF